MLLDWFKGLRYTAPIEVPNMSYDIFNHKLSNAIEKPTPNHSGVIDPVFIVMHYTAGSTAQSAINTFSSSASRVSAHLTIGEDFKVYQHAPFNIKTWHAGPSSYMGYNGLNSYAIGIEIVNTGWLLPEGAYYRRRDSKGRIVAEVPANTPGVTARHPRVGGKTYFWPDYPEGQLAVVGAVTEALLDEYNIIDIVSHEEIDNRGWKTDPGPAFPMERFKALLKNNPHRDLDEDMYEVTASSLNVRSGPGTNFGVIGGLVRGTYVPDMGHSGDWIRVSDDGWVHGAYLRRVT